MANQLRTKFVRFAAALQIVAAALEVPTFEATNREIRVCRLERPEWVGTGHAVWVEAGILFLGHPLPHSKA